MFDTVYAPCVPAHMEISGIVLGCIRPCQHQVPSCLTPLDKVPKVVRQIDSSGKRQNRWICLQLTQPLLVPVWKFSRCLRPDFFFRARVISIRFLRRFLGWKSGTGPIQVCLDTIRACTLVKDFFALLRSENGYPWGVHQTYSRPPAPWPCS